MTPWEIYLIGASGGIKTVCILLTPIFIATAFTYALMCNESENLKEHRALVRTSVLFIVLAVVFGLMATLIPSADVLHQIYNAKIIQRTKAISAEAQNGESKGDSQ